MSVDELDVKCDASAMLAAAAVIIISISVLRNWSGAVPPTLKNSGATYQGVTETAGMSCCRELVFSIY